MEGRQRGNDCIERVVIRKARLVNVSHIDPGPQAGEDDSSSVGSIGALVGLVGQSEHLECGGWIHLDKSTGTITRCSSATRL